MSYTVLDPREEIRQAIGTEWDYDQDGNNEWCLSITDDLNDTVYVPIFFPDECRTEDLDYFPYIEMKLMTSPAVTHHVGGSVKWQDCYIDVSLFIANQDNITPHLFKDSVFDEIVDGVTTNRSSVTGTYFVEVVNDGFENIEYYGKLIVFHYVLQLHAFNIDNG